MATLEVGGYLGRRTLTEGTQGGRNDMCRRARAERSVVGVRGAPG